MPSLHNHRNSPLGKSGANPRSSTDASYERNHRDTISQNPHRSRLITAPRGRDPTNPQVIERRPRGQEPRDSGRPPPRAACAYLQDAVAVACVAEVLEAEVALALGELLAQRLLQPGARRAHHRRRPAPIARQQRRGWLGARACRCPGSGGAGGQGLSWRSETVAIGVWGWIGTGEERRKKRVGHEEMGQNPKATKWTSLCLVLACPTDLFRQG